MSLWTKWKWPSESEQNDQVKVKQVKVDQVKVNQVKVKVNKWKWKPCEPLDQVKVGDPSQQRPSNKNHNRSKKKENHNRAGKKKKEIIIMPDWVIDWVIKPQYSSEWPSFESLLGPSGQWQSHLWIVFKCVSDNNISDFFGVFLILRS